MIKARVVYLCMSILLLLFIITVGIIPNIGIQTTNAAFSYEELVFNQNKVTTVDIELAEGDWLDMLENASAEEYKEATITINGKRMEHVAIRTKGNLSLREVVNSDSTRYSFKIDFDYYNNEQSLYGLTKLNLNNNYSDATLMREYISYEIMEAMGLPTPAHSYMYITVNGKEQGLYLGVEQIDATFLANKFGSNDGFLYKPDGVGSDLQYIGDDIADYTGIGLKTNEGNVENSKIIEMIEAINKGDNIEQYLDIDEMLRYFAVNTAVVNLDSYQGNMKHNYYLYEQDGVFSIIPWDYNMSFGGFSVGMGGDGNRMAQQNSQREAEQEQMQDGAEQQNSNTQTQDRSEQRNSAMQMQNEMGFGGQSSNLLADESINFSISTPVSGTTLEERPLLNALLSNSEYRAIYEGYLEEIATNYLTEEYVQNIANNLAVQLTTYVEADPTKFYTTAEFLAAVEGESSLAEFAKKRSTSIFQQLSGELVVEANTTQGNGQMPPRNRDGNEEASGQQPTDWAESEMRIPVNGEGSQQNILGQPPADWDENGMQPPSIGENGFSQPPSNWNGSEMQPPNRNGERIVPDGMRQASDFSNGTPSNLQTTNTSMQIIATITLLLLIGATVFVFKFNRRGFRYSKVRV
ncbi:CotH kinase family protein [Metasolibacillus sp. FSL K6-0083]|uniref:CotH kinase family protein n=1 Tax=Metasolibacillus sp. FSL K6-0083 TaxID=2921416 RepID=UPI00315AB354